MRVIPAELRLTRKALATQLVWSGNEPRQCFCGVTPRAPIFTSLVTQFLRCMDIIGRGESWKRLSCPESSLIMSLGHFRRCLLTDSEFYFEDMHHTEKKPALPDEGRKFGRTTRDVWIGSDLDQDKLLSGCHHTCTAQKPSK